MTKADLYSLTMQLLNGVQMDHGLFGSFLDVAQMNIEDIRPWVWLRATNSAQTAGASNTFTTAKALASDFSRFYDDDSSIVLVDSNNNPIHLRQIPIAQKFAYKNDSGVFYVDYSNSYLYICGTLTKTYAIYQNYIKIAALVSADNSNSWIFPSRFHKVLALLVAVYYKLGVDYDIVSNAQADAQASQANAILNLMTRWDSNLQNSMTRGIDPFGAC
ncbi:MAG: hypothetical protein QMD65_02010 [Patescibacteria group bacterium]|nr:hypothetical protein [Patescibacteria group bacterium]